MEGSGTEEGAWPAQDGGVDTSWGRFPRPALAGGTGLLKGLEAT